MNDTIIKTDYDGKTAFISGESKRQVRAVVHLGQIYYCANDIAVCGGYLAPHKVAARFPAEYKMKLPIPWVSKKRRGSTEAFCLSKEHIPKFLERMNADDGLRDWLFNDAIPKAEASLCTFEDKNVGQVATEDNESVCYEEDVVGFDKTKTVQIAVLIKSLDQIITDAVLLKNELSKPF